MYTCTKYQKPGSSSFRHEGFVFCFVFLSFSLCESVYCKRPEPHLWKGQNVCRNIFMINFNERMLPDPTGIALATF